MRTEVRVLPLIDRAGRYIYGPQGNEQFQVVGGPHHGKRGAWYELRELTGTFVSGDDAEAINAETGALLGEAHLRITVGPEEKIRLDTLAAERGITAEELIESFIADLTTSIRNNGSDERLFAEEWLQRVCWPRQV